MTDVVPVPAKPAPAFPAFTAERRRALRVKIKSLAEEARIIRADERRALVAARRHAADGRGAAAAGLRAAFGSLRAHRRNEVRTEARHALLAYALLRGRTLESAERTPTCMRQGIIPLTLRRIAQRFSPDSRGDAAWETVVRGWLGLPV